MSITISYIFVLLKYNKIYNMRHFSDFFQQCEHSGAKYWFERSIYSTERDSSAFDMQRNRTYDCLLFLGMYSTYHFGVIEYNNDWSTLKIRWRERL